MVAKTPPMGWNSWDCYGTCVTEEQLLSNARYMKENLKEYGYKYIVCDIQWYEPLAGTEGWDYRPFAKLCIDEYSRLIPAENRFPSSSCGKGFKPIADKIHHMGLLFGIHIMRGIPRGAVHEGRRIKGTDATADKIADPFSISRWNGDMYGVNAENDGAYEYYKSIFEMYRDWGVDYIKVDDICNTNLYKDNPYSAAKEIELIRRAIDECGRPMVLSLSPGPAIIEQAWHLKKHANMWRITDDFWDDWKLLKDMFRRCEIWQSHVSPGNWPDCDMLPLGKIALGLGEGRDSKLTKDEQLTMMTLWSIFRSPLIMGGEMTLNDDWTLKLLTNPEVIRVNQEGNSPVQLRRDEDEAVWINRISDTELYLAMFNLSDEEKDICQSICQLGGERAAVRDLWKREELGEYESAVSSVINPHGAVMLKITLLTQ